MTLREKHESWVRDLGSVGDGQERLALIVRRGREGEPMPAAFRTEAHLIPGCLSRLWFAAEMREGRCRFWCDSDSAVVKGVASLLCGFYSGATPGEILAHEGDVLAEAGIQHHLTLNRRQGLGHLRTRIHQFASQNRQEGEWNAGETCENR